MTSVTLSSLIAFTMAAAVCPSIALARKVQYQDCGPEKNIRMMEVDNCNVQPCRVFHRTTIKMTTFLNSPVNSSSAEWEIRAFVNGRPYGHPEPVSDACISVNSTSATSSNSYSASSDSTDQMRNRSATFSSIRPICPLIAGKFYRFSHTFYVHDQFPKVATTMQYLLKGDHGVTIACARLHILMSS